MAIYSGFSHWKILIFHSYVSLPEGMLYWDTKWTLTWMNPTPNSSNPKIRPGRLGSGKAMAFPTELQTHSRIAHNIPHCGWRVTGNHGKPGHTAGLGVVRVWMGMVSYLHGCILWICLERFSMILGSIALRININSFSEEQNMLLKLFCWDYAASISILFCINHRPGQQMHLWWPQGGSVESQVLTSCQNHIWNHIN